MTTEPNNQITPQNACDALRMRLESAIRQRTEIYPCHSNRASSLGFPCLKEKVLERTRGREKRMPSPELMAIFEKGHMEHRYAIEVLGKAGIHVTMSERPFEDNAYNITGHIDGMLVWDGISYIPEIKSMHPYQYARMNEWRDFLKHPIYCKYPSQGQLYMFMDAEQKFKVLIFILVDKGTGAMKFLPMEFDYAYCERLLQKAEAINKHVAAGTLPECREWDEQICGRYCDFSHICLPDMVGAGMNIVDNEVLEGMLEERSELAPAHRKYVEIDKSVSKAVKEMTGAIVGRFVVDGEWVDRKGFEVKPSTSWRKDIKEIPK